MCSMTYQGTVQGGVVVLNDNVTLPDGMEVEVSPLAKHEAAGIAESRESTWDKLLELAKWAETQPCDLPEDLALNHDHYPHGQPKRS